MPLNTEIKQTIFWGEKRSHLMVINKKMLTSELWPFLNLFSLVSSFKSILNFVEQQWYYSWGDTKFHAFLKAISPKVNVTARLKFELVYFKAAISHVSHYALGTPLSSKSPI